MEAAAAKKRPYYERQGAKTTKSRVSASAASEEQMAFARGRTGTGGGGGAAATTEDYKFSRGMKISRVCKRTGDKSQGWVQEVGPPLIVTEGPQWTSFGGKNPIAAAFI